MPGREVADALQAGCDTPGQQAESQHCVSLLVVERTFTTPCIKNVSTWHNHRLMVQENWGRVPVKVLQTIDTSACCTEVAFAAAAWTDVRSLPLTWPWKPILPFKLNQEHRRCGSERDYM